MTPAAAVPAQGQTPKDSAGKKVSDLISEDTTISETGEVTGTLHYVTEMTTFPKEEQSGHFMPVMLDEKYEGKEFTVVGKQTKKSTDRDWILRVADNNSAFTFSTEEDGQILKLTFAGATLTPPVNVLPQEHDLGKYGKIVNEIVGPDTKIAADGSVTGTFKYVEPWAENHDREGYFLPVRLDAQYKDKPITVQRNGGNAATSTDEDWILTVIDKDTEISFKDGDVEFLKLTFKDAVFEKETPADYTAIVGQAEDAGYGKQGSDLMSDNVAISWDGTNGTVTGNFHNIEDWSTLPGGTKSGHFFALKFNDKFKGKSFDFIMDDQEPGTHTDSAGEDEMYWVLRIDTTKTFTFKSDNKVIAKLDFNGATLDD